MKFFNIMFVAVPMSLMACGGKSTPSATIAVEASNRTALCESALHRARTCKESFLPALLESRISHDSPAGIAAEGSTPAGRESLLVQAQQEYATDSTDENISKACAQMAAKADPAMDAMAKEVQGCVATSSCGEFVPCFIAAHEHMPHH
jgi:hypothetical protein